MNGLTAAAPADMTALNALMVGSRAPLHFLAGGTDLLIAGRLPNTGMLIDISRVSGMAFIDADGPDICIGAASTVSALAEHEGLRTRFPALCHAASQFGSAQIRNRATIGGNIANAAPSADLVPVLLAAEAWLRLIEPGSGQHEIPLAGYAATAGCLIAEVVVPGATLTSHSAFVKLGPRHDVTISRLSLALLADFNRGRFGRVRLVAGSIGPVARRLNRAAAALEGQPLEAGTLRSFATALAAEIDAAIPGRASLGYKRRAIIGLGFDVVARTAGLSPRDPFFEEALG
jgi:carbon-monoxide dehydrogenase medium subunit